MSYEKSEITEDVSNATITQWRNAVSYGEWAKKFKLTEDYFKVQNAILGALKDQAIALLERATTDEERISAQQKFLAVSEFDRMLERMILAGDHATQLLISTPKEGE